MMKKYVNTIVIVVISVLLMVLMIVLFSKEKERVETNELIGSENHRIKN